MKSKDSVFRYTDTISIMFNLFKKKQPKFGSQIFIQRSWLEKNIDDAVYERHIEQGSGFGVIKEQTEDKAEENKIKA